MSEKRKRFKELLENAKAGENAVDWRKLDRLGRRIGDAVSDYIDEVSGPVVGPAGSPPSLAMARGELLNVFSELTRITNFWRGLAEQAGFDPKAIALISVVSAADGVALAGSLPKDTITEVMDMPIPSDAKPA